MALMVYLGFAIPGYFDLLAHQGHWIVVGDDLPVTQNMPDAPKLALLIPKTNHQEPRAVSTVQNPTSFPPWYPFVIMIPFAALTFFFGTILTWLGVELLPFAPLLFRGTRKKA